MPATLPQETGDHDPELGGGWRAQDKERNHGELIDGEVIRKVTQVLLGYSLMIET